MLWADFVVIISGVKCAFFKIETIFVKLYTERKKYKKVNIVSKK